MSQAQVTITRRGTERVRGGHLWVYRSDVREAGVAAGGSVVAVRDERGRFVGRALYSDRSEIALRVLTTRDEAVGSEWWRERLRASAARRAGLEREADAFRLVYSEGDLMPSLIVDRYSDVLVLQTLSQGTESLKATLVELLVEEFAPRAVVERNGESVLALDISAEAVAAARRNAELNGAARVEFREANVFDALRELESAGERFDTIVLDPPAFAKNRASVAAAARGYKEINLRALKMLERGGTLVTCTCSYHMNEPLFLELISDAAADSHRRVQIVDRRTHARDHPVLLGLPEPLYLKCVIARVVE